MLNEKGRKFTVLKIENVYICNNLSICVAMSAERRTNDLEVRDLNPPEATRHVRYVLLIIAQIS